MFLVQVSRSFLVFISQIRFSRIYTQFSADSTNVFPPCTILRPSRKSKVSPIFLYSDLHSTSESNETSIDFPKQFHYSAKHLRYLKACDLFSFHSHRISRNLLIEINPHGPSVTILGTEAMLGARMEFPIQSDDFETNLDMLIGIRAVDLGKSWGIPGRASTRRVGAYSPQWMDARIELNVAELNVPLLCPRSRKYD